MNSPRSASLDSRSGVIRRARSRSAHLVPGGQVALHAIDDLVQDARLGRATDVRHLGLDLEALGVTAAQLVEGPVGDLGEKRGIEHLVDATSVLAHGETVPARLSQIVTRRSLRAWGTG